MRPVTEEQKAYAQGMLDAIALKPRHGVKWPRPGLSGAYDRGWMKVHLSKQEKTNGILGNT